MNFYKRLWKLDADSLVLYMVLEPPHPTTYGWLTSTIILLLSLNKFHDIYQILLLKICCWWIFFCSLSSKLCSRYQRQIEHDLPGNEKPLTIQYILYQSCWYLIETKTLYEEFEYGNLIVILPSTRKVDPFHARAILDHCMYRNDQSVSRKAVDLYML